MKASIETKYWVQDEQGNLGAAAITEADLQALVNQGTDPRVNKVGEPDWKAASTHGILPTAPVEAAEAVTPPPPDAPPPADTEPDNLEFLAPVDELEAKLIAHGIDSVAFLAWAKEATFAKKSCKKISTAFDDANARKVLDKWDSCVAVVKQRMAAQKKTAEDTAAQGPGKLPEGALPSDPESEVKDDPVAPPADTPVAPPVDPAPPPAVVEAEIVVAETAQADAPIVVQPTQAIGLAEASGGQITGDFVDEDFRMPSMKIAQGNTPVVTEHGVGAVLVSGSLLMGPPAHGEKAQKPLTVVPAAFRKNFTENLPYDPDSTEVARTLDTIQEVDALGGTIRWNGDTPPSWISTARVLFFIKKPTDETHPAYNNPMFTQEADDGSLWGLAVVWCRKTSYASCAKEILTAARGVLNFGSGDIRLSSKQWTLTYSLVPAGKFQVWTPKIVLTNTDAPKSIQAEGRNLANAFASGTGVETE